ncbi:GtrA family protein [Marisediminicola sp. LYQ134]|uniref:GtrA family protein n=1 Tax=unclassified Marisediminicola TaxID=2618316 RepID=UPI003982EFB9
MHRLASQLTKFGLVGLVGLAVDVGLFNLLRATVLSPADVAEGPLVAKVVSTAVAIAVNWLGNRHWTFRSPESSAATTHRETVVEGVKFAIVSVGGMLIALVCLWVSHYVLGFTSAFADNVSANVVGLVLGSAFRFALYRAWVFREAPAMSSGTPESAVRPPGLTPDHGVDAVAAVEQSSARHH